MTLAERLLAVAEDPGFERLKRVRADLFEVWIRDGVVHVLSGRSIDEVVAEAEKRIARRSP